MDVTIRDFTKALQYNLDHDIKRPIMVLGAPGIGKSESARQVAEKNNMAFIDLRLLLYSETDLKGIPFPNREKGTTEYFPNTILPREGGLDKGLMLIDEITSAPKRVQTAAYQLVQDYRLGDYVVPEGWVIVAAGNREEDDGYFVQMPAPLANRMEILTASPDLDIWKADYAYPKKVNEKVIAYLNFKPVALHTQDPQSRSMSFASPRSWTAVSDILNTGASIEDSLTQVKIRGNIGDIEASSFFKFLEFEEKLPRIPDILVGKLKNPPEEKSLCYLLLSSLASNFAHLGVFDSVKQISEEDRVGLVNTVNYMFGMLPEFFSLGMKDLISVNPDIVKRIIMLECDSPEVIKFIKDNSYLWK